jgi:predicted nucleic-acid-binding protein
MRALDPSVLVRVIARDDDVQVLLADAVVSEGAWVSLLVLQEAIWVLERAFELGLKQQGVVIDMLLQHKTIALESPEVVAAALASFRDSQRIGFSDALVLEVARRAGHLPVATSGPARALEENGHAGLFWHEWRRALGAVGLGCGASPRSEAVQLRGDGGW